jgi:hypothetical protein
VKADEFQKQIDARNANETAWLRWENSLLKKIVAAGYPLTVDFADRKKHLPETAASN